jgi:hypothetical protein
MFEGICIILIGLCLYFLPTTLAGGKTPHPYVSAIFALNLLTGWTGIGWIAALVWALANPRKAMR